MIEVELEVGGDIVTKEHYDHDSYEVCDNSRLVITSSISRGGMTIYNFDKVISVKME